MIIDRPVDRHRTSGNMIFIFENDQFRFDIFILFQQIIKFNDFLRMTGGLRGCTGCQNLFILNVLQIV